MSESGFVHLHVHSQYSLLEATCVPKAIAKRAAEMNMPAVALTDNGNMFGAIEFYFACKDAGVKPIVGLEVYIAPRGRLVKGEDKDSANAQPSSGFAGAKFRGLSKSLPDFDSRIQRRILL